MSGQLSALSAIGGSASMTAQPNELAVAGSNLGQASPLDAHSFASAIAGVPEVQAQAPTSAALLGQDLTQRLEGLSDRLQAPVQPGAATSDTASPSGKPDSNAPAGGSSMLADAMTQMQSVYAFTIETTLVSRGSTETTKIFNSLLKGQ